MKKLFSSFVFIALATTLVAQNVTGTLHLNQEGNKIYKEIYGQFAEHLGSCIYGGLWVGPDSEIPNVDGYRKDVLEALQALRIPVLRWPGGCFADEYHWRDGIGPRDQRPSMKNNNWGGTLEDNSFGTHEFLNLCELLGCEPYISGNVGSGTVEEMAKWVEYMTSEEGTPMAKLRQENGREKPWKVKYFGVGNESWGCGGNMRPEFYSDLYRRYAVYCRDYDGNRLYKVASGASDYDYNWTRVLMDRIDDRMDGISLHYYTTPWWDRPRGLAGTFSDEEYYWTLGKCLEIEDVIKRHKAIMDERDPKRHIGLLVDEWGTWWDEEPGTTRGHLYQQNALRDAIVAALSLNVFHRHTDRIRMANIAQIANVLQSMVLTDQKDGGHIVLTPTYHVFQMYQPFQEATFLPIELDCKTLKVRHECDRDIDESRENGYRNVPLVSASAAKTVGGDIVVALTNVSLDQEQTVEIALDGDGKDNPKTVKGRILTAEQATDCNDFAHPMRVAPADFRNATIKKGVLKAHLPAKSVVVLTLE